ncbi:hypothetical protein DPMN_132657 [Dreissena polymorpha]|uniref:CCHC-type domain-containing protein n=1 Tax=Dreissena polymorpha TaxID=45954 RepID=A0A9D4FWD5_DREPO|nr:hypothetical protein DPMN_132657 [Dreissena polymorpha]
MRRRPPLCLRCMRLGHMRGDCPGTVTKGAVSVSGGKPAQGVGEPVEWSGASSKWTDVVRKGKKQKQAPKKQDAAPVTPPSGDQTPAPVTPEVALVPSQDMEVSETSAKRKLETEGRE